MAKENEYASMKFDVMGVVNDVFYHIPIFKKYAEFHAPIKQPLDKALKYIGLMYDMGSPLVASIEDIREREKAAIVKTWDAFPPAEYKAEVTKLTSCEDDVYNAMTLRYIWLQGSLEYSTLVVLMQAHRRNLELLWSKKEKDTYDDAEQRLKIEKEIPAQLERISELKRKIAAGDNRMVNLIADNEAGIAEMKALQYLESSHL